LAALDVDSLQVEYTMRKSGQALVAIGQISFQVGSGEFVAVLGPSGCGKTTLLNTISGTLPPTRGSVRIEGRPVTQPGFESAVVFQSAALFPWRTVIRNITYGLELRGLPVRQAVDQVRPLIKLVGLEGFEDSYPGELSGGMQQRANLARALAVQPKVLLCDEPLSSLDAQMREMMQFELQKIIAETGKTVLFITHQISEAIYLGDRIIILTARPGRVKEIVPVNLPRPRPLAIKNHPRFHELEEHIWNLLQGEIAADPAPFRPRMEL
jgi:NitT/TauT family transport system ATP-binding protein